MVICADFSTCYLLFLLFHLVNLYGFTIPTVYLKYR
jgi:hypothetical protein